MRDLGLPDGVRDYLPDAARRLTEVTRRLGRVFEAHGYQRVVLPSIERIEVAARGLDEDARRQLFQSVEPGTGEVVAVCPDHTPQIARMWAASLHRMRGPVRLFYAGPVLRATAGRAGRPRETVQIGVELLGAGSALADGEVLLLARESLAAVGLEGFVLDVGHAGFARALLDAAQLAQQANAARAALARKDRAALEQIVSSAPRASGSAGKARRVLPGLADLYGQNTLGRARKLARQAGLGASFIDEVEAAVAATDDRDGRVTVDLGEVRGWGYYTGLTLHGFAPGAGGPVLAGGRYDSLLGRYGRAAPAIGFAIDMHFLATALGDPHREPAGLVVVAGEQTPAELLRTCRQLRAAGHRVAVFESGRGKNDALEFARAHGFARILRAGRSADAWRVVDITTGATRKVALADFL